MSLRSAGSQHSHTFTPFPYPTKIQFLVCDVNSFLFSLRIRNIGKGTKDAEIGGIRFLLLPGNIGDATLERTGRRVIGDMDIGGNGEIPERRRQLGFYEHRCSSNNNVKVSFLSYAILVRLIGLSMLLLDPRCYTEPFLKRLNRITLLPEELSDLEAARIVNKGDPIAIAVAGGGRGPFRSLWMRSRGLERQVAVLGTL